MSPEGIAQAAETVGAQEDSPGGQRAPKGRGRGHGGSAFQFQLCHYSEAENLPLWVNGGRPSWVKGGSS